MESLQVSHGLIDRARPARTVVEGEIEEFVEPESVESYIYHLILKAVKLKSYLLNAKGSVADLTAVPFESSWVELKFCDLIW